MKKAPSLRFGSWLLIYLLPWLWTTASWAAEDRLRVNVETDIGGDADDQASLVRFLLHCSQWDVEAIVANRSADACSGMEKTRSNKQAGR